MDGKSFVDCILHDCVLEYSGGSLVLERTQLTGCRYVFFGGARGTVHFLQSVGLLADTGFSEFPELVH